MLTFEEWKKTREKSHNTVARRNTSSGALSHEEWLANRSGVSVEEYRSAKGRQEVGGILGSLESIYADSYASHAERYKSGKYDQYSTAGEYSTQLADRRKQWDDLAAQLGDPSKNYKQYFTPQEWESIQTSVKNQGLDFDRMSAFSEDEQAYFSNWKDEYAWKAYDNAANLDIEKSKKEYADMTKRYDDGDDSVTSGQLMVKKLQIRNAELVQNQIKKAEQENAYMQKYAGFTADQAKAQLQNMEDGDEKFWLEDYVFIKEAKESGIDTTDPLFEKKLYKKYLERMMAAGEERFAKKSERATSSAYQARKEYEDYITSLPADMTDEERGAAIREAQMLLSTKQQERTEAATEANAAKAGYSSNHDALLDVTAEITLAEMSEEDRQLWEDYYKSKAIRNDWHAAKVYEKLLASGYTEQQIVDLVEYQSRQENAKVSKAVEDWWRDFSKTNFATQLLSEATSFATNFVSYVTDPITSLADMMDGSSYMTGDPNRLGYVPGKMASISRQEFSKWAESWGGEVASTAFKIGESIADNLGRIAIGGGAGSLVLAGTGSFGQTYRNIIERGGERWQAATMGVISGALEIATEKISLDRLIDMKKNGALKGFWKKALASGVTGAIEVSEEEINFLGQLAAEAVIMADRSNYNVRVQELMSLGLSKEDAEDKATRELLAEAGEIAIVSLGSGFGMGMIQSARDSATRNKRTGKEIMQGEGGVEAVKGFAGKVAETASPEMQQKLTKQAAKAKNARQIGKLFNTTIEAINSQTEAQLAENLQRNGLTEKAATSMAKSLVSSVRSGNPVSEAHMDLFTHLAKDMRVKNAVKQTFESESFQKNMIRVQDFNNKIHKSRYKTTEALAKEATEAGYKISESGRSLEGARIVNTKDGVALEMDGQQVKAQDIELKESDAIAVKAISDLGAGADVSNQLLNIYRSTSVAAPDFVSQMAVGFELGYAGFGEGGLSNALGKVSPISRQAFELGKQQRTQEEKSGKKVNLTDKAAVWYIGKDGSVRHIREGKEGQLTTAGQQSTAIKAAHFLQRMGVVGGNVYLFESYETVEKDGKVYQKFRDSNGVEQLAPNGMYRSDTGDIYIDINAGMNAEGITLVTFAHELTHMVQQWSPEKYRVLGDFLAEQYEKEGVDAHAAVKATQARLTALRGSQVSYTEAYHEWMAESMSTLFNDGKIYDKLVALKNKDKGLFNFLKRQIDRLAKLSRKYYEGRLAETAEARFVQRLSPAAIEQLQQKFADALVEAGENYTKGAVYTETVEAEVQYSTKNNGKYMDAARMANAKNKLVDKQTMDKAEADRKAVADKLTELSKNKDLGIPEDIEGNTYFANSSYSGSEENTTICPRSLASEAFVDAVSEMLGRPLSVAEQIYISQDLQGKTLTPECLYCYVATDRKAYRAFLGEYIAQRDAVIEKVKANPNADLVKLYDEFLNGRKDTGNMHKRFSMWVELAKTGKPMITANDLTNMQKLMGDLKGQFGADLVPQIKDAMAYAQSASWAKKRVGYVAYNGHILKWKQNRIDKLNSEYGLRMYSFSDFSPAFILENMQMITDAAVRGLKMLAYTKDLDFVKIFAKTGTNINISTFGFEMNGQIHENALTGASWAEAQRLRAANPNVGITFVATSDNLVRWAMEQDWIDVVIPYHLVRTGAEVAKKLNYTNYTSESADVKDIGWNSEEDAKSIPPTMHNNDLQQYLQALSDNHLKPRFERFMTNPDGTPNQNYMKLVNETRQSAAESKAVQPVFDLNAAQVSLGKLELNGYTTHIGGSVDAMYEIAQQVSENIADGSYAETYENINATNVKPQNSDRNKASLDMGSAVEQTRDLLAFHNISAAQLLDAIDRGGLLMPSLAVTNKNMTDFGDISLVFDKSVIDPQVNAKNRLWGADAWTPSQTELKLNAKFDSKEVARTVEAMRKSLGQQAAKELLAFTPYQFTQAIHKADGSIFTAYANNIGVQAAYAMEKGLLKQIPMKNGKVDMAALQEQLKDGRVSGSDQGWRSYKAWLTEISDRVIKSYDQATNADILRNMEAQAATGKTFKLSVNGDLVVPAAEYSSIEQLRQNKGRLSQDAATAAKEAGQKLLDFAKQFAKGDITVKAAVDAVNMGFAQRYDVAGIRSTFQNRGISMTQEQATQMQELYKEAVELSTLYFEAKPAGQIGVEQIAVAVVPDSSDMAQVTDSLESKGVEVRQYPAGDQQARSEIMRSLDDLKFQDRNRPTGETVADALEGVAGQGDLLTVERYREAYGKLHREEKALLDANAQLRQIETGAVQATQGEIRALRTEANRAKRMMAQHQKSLTAVENSIPYKRMTEKLRQQGVTVSRTTDENGISVYSYVDAYAKRKPAAKPAQKVAAPSPDESVGAAPKGFDTLTSMEMEYGNLPEGEKPVRDDTLPKSTDGNDKVSLTARTVKGAKATPDEFVDLLDRKVVEGGLSYIPISHNKSTQEAIDYIQNLGWKDALEKWKGEVDKGVSSAKMSAVGALLLNNAAKAGDRDAWLDILHEYQKMGTSAGQAVSAMRILKTLNPDDSLYMIKRSIEQMITDMGAAGKNIQINPDLERKYMAAKTDAVRDEVLDEITRDVARQLPSSFLEKWTAIRYLSMLGNFRTQVRNVTGNIGMALTKKIKDSIAASLEAIAYHASGGKFQRTKSVFANRTQLKAAKADFDYVKDLVLGGGKYSDTAAESSAFAQKVQDARKILPIGAEQCRRLTNWAMETGDAVFSKAAYARALAGWLKANGITETDFSKIDPSTMDAARTYAVKEAQEATFRDYNALSSWVSKAGRGKGTPKLIKGISEGIMPFRKTPANILVRAVEYSPMGFVNSVSKSVQAMLGKGDVTGADVVNSWAKTLTGTGLFALGMLLQSVGILVGGPDDDENKDKFESQYGWQNYALVLDDTTITIDFLSPSAIPMFMGAELNKLSQEDGIEAKDIEAALFSIAEPLIEMSMLQGVNDTLDNVQYAESSMGQLLINSALSYLTQGITNTMLGQIERSGEDTRMTTYVDPDSPLPAWLQRQMGKASAKIPGWDYNQIPYINAWGEEEKNPELIANAAENMFSPSYISTGKNDKVFRELNRLNDVQTKNVYPSTPGRTITYTDTDGVAHKDYALSADEWVALAKKQGQTAHQLVKEMIVSDLYKDLPDAQKGQAITKAYEYARELARQEVLPGYPDDFDAKWMADLKGDIAHGILEHINEESIPSRFKAGDISASEALDLRLQYSNEDEEEAAETVAYWNFQAENPDYDDLSKSHTIKWLEDVQKTGMELEVYYEFCNQYPKLKDEDGKKDKKAIKALIEEIADEENLTYKQKKALKTVAGI